jgi:precorrin-3B C17-methyltransferase
MTGRITVVGLGPGDMNQLTPEASAALLQAAAVFGYTRYLDRIPQRAGQRRYPSDNRQEYERAERALAFAADGAEVVVVSGGDPGVFAMAAVVCEALERGPREWLALDLTIVPGISAMFAVAARVGAPLGHDFCTLSLSDNLKTWELIEQRLLAAASAGFVIALYNPVSRARPWQLGRAFDVLRDCLPFTTPVIFGRAIGRPGERVTVSPLSAATAADADMSTCIIVGSALTRIIERPARSSLVYTPRASPD